MKAFVVLSLIGYLVVPSGAAVLGRCVVAKKLHEGGLSNFEGYSLENCEYAFSAPSLLTSFPSVLCPGIPNSRLL